MLGTCLLEFEQCSGCDLVPLSPIPSGLPYLDFLAHGPEVGNLKLGSQLSFAERTEDTVMYSG